MLTFNLVKSEAKKIKKIFFPQNNIPDIHESMNLGNWREISGDAPLNQKTVCALGSIAKITLARTCCVYLIFSSIYTIYRKFNILELNMIRPQYVLCC